MFCLLRFVDALGNISITFVRLTAFMLFYCESLFRSNSWLESALPLNCCFFCLLQFMASHKWLIDVRSLFICRQNQTGFKNTFRVLVVNVKCVLVFAVSYSAVTLFTLTGKPSNTSLAWNNDTR